MMLKQNRNCPNCESYNHEIKYQKEIKNFDGFNLLCEYKIVQCNNCNFIFNNNIDDNVLNEFYNKESLYSSESSYGTGGNNSGDINRYNTYLNNLKEHLTNSSLICDVGCGKGGFVKFLTENGYKDSLGIELDQRLVDLSNSKKILKMEPYKYPFKNKEINCLTFTHVFEHILNLKEHINHFTKESLQNLVENSGFELISYEQSGIYYTNEKYSYPSLRCVFRKTQIQNIKQITSFPLVQYIAQENIKIQIHINDINNILKTFRNIYFWGIGQEFFTLISNMNINFDNYNISLLDINKDKQKLTVNGLKIQDPSNITTTNPEETCIIICSVFNNEIIKNTILQINKDLNYYEL